MLWGKGEDSSGVWVWTRKQWGSPPESLPPGQKRIIWPSLPLCSGVQECCCTAPPSGQRPEGSASSLVFFSQFLSPSGIFWVVLCCFFGLLSEQTKAQGVSVQVIPAGIAYPKVTQCRVCCPYFFWPQKDLTSHTVPWFNFFRHDWVSKVICLYRWQRVNERCKPGKNKLFLLQIPSYFFEYFHCLPGVAITAKFPLIFKVDLTGLFPAASRGGGDVTSARPTPGRAALAAEGSRHQSHKHSPSTGYHLCQTSSGPFYIVEWTRHWLTPQSVGSVSKLTFSLKSYTDKLAAMLWVLAISPPWHMSWAQLCTGVDAIAMCVYKCIFHVHGRFKNRHTCGSRHVCLKAFIFLWRGRPNSTKHWGRTLCFHFSPAILVCKSCEVRKDFTSLKANILTAVLAVEAVGLIHTAVTFSLSED